MIATRPALAAFSLFVFGWVATAADGNDPPGPVAARVRALIDIVRTDPDERRQRAAVAELADSDPRVHTEVIPALVRAMKQESAEVRAKAAEVLGRFRATSALAGAALEASAESDPSPAVRTAARQALWQYHLNGYRSANGAASGAFQTQEPPIAKPARPRTPVAVEPPPAPVATVVALAFPLPPVGVPPGPRVTALPGFFGPRSLLSTSRHPNPTVEPPLARRPDNWFPPPTVPDEPPLPPQWLHPATAGKPPPFVVGLPPVVADPGPIPGALPAPTAEPPLAGKAGR